MSSLIFSQSNYPLQTIIKGDSVVILTKKQAKDINDIFELQKSKLVYYKQQLTLKDSLIINSDTILLEKQRIIDSLIFNESAIQSLNLIKDWLLDAAINSTWIYYSWTDSLIYSVNLSQYYVRKDDVTGDILFLKSDDIVDPRKDKQEPPRDWQKEIIEPKRPVVTTAPIKL